ncbi:YifB family Mg chelatase-like AAA ATPase [Deinococcus yavapaiensis]|uniref:Magnesium chelatase family protein n=1 Tax=Deinococcus yavapaiensis KR-236 TaxID=694435 RepID=A0A318SA79_9DEIO|nr:YifB family Mg chelatase-like AAA ATPase [Deinococcus yavapaiensis]PYE53390.1 magnesium chelatase family protein [Deinococcus yavapaiensis KR-236]
MLATVTSVALVGVDAVPITVEVDVSSGLPAFNIVGLPDQAVSEARERVRAAIRNSALPFPAARITVNLAPADLRKEGPLFDLPIALGVLAAQGLVPIQALEGHIIAGELALDGSLRPVPGAVNLALKADELDLDVIVPEASALEAALIEDVRVFGAPTLLEVVRHLIGELPLHRAAPPPPPPLDEDVLCLSDIKGQGGAKRALEIALAGGHNLLLIGSPGSGKTMLARRASSLLPLLTRSEALEVTRVHSAAGLLTSRSGMRLDPPYRAPHASVSSAGLIGGGSIPKPGEVSLAHRGVLFLDEFPEFDRDAIEALRQPLEDGTVTISRARVSVTYPARFQLIAAMNPCPCGHLGDPERSCTCTPSQRARYAARISGPLLDRVDLVVSVPRLTVDDLTRAPIGERSVVVRERVRHARARMTDRQGERNSLLAGAALREHTALDGGPETFARAAARSLALTGRGFDRVLRVARTIADLAGDDRLTEAHLAEAIAYRPRDLAQAL